MPGFLALIPPAAWRWIAVVLVAVAFGGFCYMKGDAHGTAKLTNYQAKEATEAVRIAKGREVVTTQVVTHYVAVKGATEVVTRTVKEEVVKYASTNTSSCLDPEWRRLYNASALNAVPAAASGTDGASGAPTAAEALSTGTENNARANRTADKLEGLQAWVLKQQQIK